MGFAVFGFAFICILSLSSSCKENALDQLWNAYKLKHGKHYLLNEESPRRMVWEQNVHRIGLHNLEADFGLQAYKLELNKFSDMLESELDSYRNCFKASEKVAVGELKHHECNRRCQLSLPESIDWREKNLVTPVKDQGDCGSCWAFSSTGALEGQTKAKRGYLVSLSEQNLIDCSWKEGNHGCNGGWMDYAFNYVIHNQGIDTESSYPYLGKDDVCKFVPSGIGANCSSFVKIKAGSEMSLKAAVANIGPVSVAISINGYKFMHYKEGIYYEKHCSRTDLSHAVLVVGYGTRKGTDYWIVKNSWGTSWGMDGYILMARNMHNLCGIATHALYPVV